jgi:hypothetical protein
MTLQDSLQNRFPLEFYSMDYDLKYRDTKKLHSFFLNGKQGCQPFRFEYSNTVIIDIPKGSEFPQNIDMQPEKGVTKKISKRKVKFSDKIKKQRPRNSYSFKEDLLLSKYMRLFPFKWEKISSFLKNRSSTMIKNRYYSYHRHGINSETMNRMVQNFEYLTTVDEYPEDILEDFRQFM